MNWSNWQTTAYGILSIIGGLISMVAIPLLDADPATTVDISAVIAFLSTAAAGIGLIKAQDAKRSPTERRGDRI